VSVELRIVDDGVCCCGVPYPTDDPPPQHGHWVECDWGVIEHGQPRPDRNQVGHLMLATPDYVQSLLSSGPKLHHGAIHEASIVNGRTFAHIGYGDKRWTWELFEAHFDDGKGPDILLGRWPD
jgi:hypothetical protein